MGNMRVTGLSILQIGTRADSEQILISNWVALWSSEKIASLDTLESKYPNVTRLDHRTFQFPVADTEVKIIASIFISPLIMVIRNCAS